MNQRCPTLASIFERVFIEKSYDNVRKAIIKEDLSDPIVMYPMSIVIS
jgi:hypothetical protein